MKKRLLSLLLVLVMVLSLVPTVALATGETAEFEPAAIEAKPAVEVVEPVEEETELVKEEAELVFEDTGIILEDLGQKAAPKKAAKLMSTPPAEGDVCQVGETGYASLDEAIVANKNKAVYIDITSTTKLTVTAEAELQAGDWFRVDKSDLNLVAFVQTAIPDDYGIKITGLANSNKELVGYKFLVAPLIAENTTTNGRYVSIDEAVTAASDGDTIKLLYNQTLSYIQIKNTKTITLDLNKKKIDFSNVGFYLSDNVNLTIKNGTVNSTYLLVYATATPNLTLENLQMNLTGDTGSNGVLLNRGGTLNLVNTDIKITSPSTKEATAIYAQELAPYKITIDKDSTVESTWDCVDLLGGYDWCGYSGGTIDIYGKLSTSGKYYDEVHDGNVVAAVVSTLGSQQTADDIINIYPGAELTSIYGCAIYAPAKGVINMTGGKMYGGAIAGIAIKSGKLNVSGGEIICTGEKVDPVEGYSNGVNASGAAIQIESNAGYYGNIEVNISGDAKITSADGYSVYEYANGTDPMRVKSLSITGGQFTGLISLSEELAGSATGKGFISAGLYDKEIKGDKVKFIADGYDCIPNTDPATKADYPWIVTHVEVKVDQASIEEKVNGGKVTTTEGELGDDDKTNAKNAITEMAKNTAVQSFAETNIDNATRETSTTADGYNISMVLDAVKEAAKDPAKNLAQKGVEDAEAIDGTAAATQNGQITIKTENITDVDVDKKINVELEAAKVEIKTETEQQTTKTTTVNGATYDVKPTATITVTNDDGSTTKITAVIPNDAITKPITFRLPIDKKITAATTAVWHSDSLENPKADYLGVYPIQTENGEKFVELSADEFSYYTYENMTEVADTSVVAIRTTDGKYVGFNTLAEAITAFNVGTDEDENTVDNAAAIILLKDVTEDANFAEKTIELDLAGHKLKGASTNAASVTVKNSGEKQNTLAATGTYANNVKAFVADGYDTKTTTTTDDTVFNTHDIDYTVIVNAIADDRDTENGTQTGRVDGKTDVNLVDVYAGDTVTVTVTVNGARFVAADITMQYDPTLFKPTTDLSAQEYTWKWDEENHQYRYTATGGSHYYEDGTVLGTFTFKTKAVSEDLVANNTNVGWFKVYGTNIGGEGNIRKAFVSDSWSAGYAEDPSNALNEQHAINDYVNIIMKSTMTGAVDANTGMVYNATAQNLVKSNTFTAKVNGVDIIATDGATIQYYMSETAVTSDDAIKALTYVDTAPTAVNAGTYYVYYKISAPGYTSVYGNRTATIAKKQVTLIWTMGADTNTNQFTRTYDSNGYTAPTATFIAQNGNEPLNATVTLKTFDGAASTDPLKAVGTYVYEATYVDLSNGKENYTFTPNPNATVTITGREMKGWKLEATTEQYIDGKTHPVASLTLDDTVDGFGPAADAAGLEITFRYSKDNGATWTDMGPYTSDADLTVVGAKNAYEKAVAAIPVESAEGTYKLQMTVKADTYETTTFDVTTFNIKKPVYVVETSEYVSGWTEILVYTNEAVTFRYGDDETNMLYDVTDFGYRYQNTMSYSHVYAIVVEGEANLGKIFASNEAAKSLNLPTNSRNQYDVNTTGETANVALEDAVAAQSVYNVNADYLKNPEKMAIVLRCDVNRDKKVNVAGDVSAILNEYVTNWNS